MCVRVCPVAVIQLMVMGKEQAEQAAMHSTTGYDEPDQNWRAILGQGSVLLCSCPLPLSVRRRPCRAQSLAHMVTRAPVALQRSLPSAILGDHNGGNAGRGLYV